MVSASPSSDAAQLSFDRTPAGALLVHLGGAWQLGGQVPAASLLEQELGSGGLQKVEYDAANLSKWDTSVLTFLTQVSEVCRQRGISEDRNGLPAGVQRLLALAEAVGERKGARAEQQDESLLERIGKATLSSTDEIREILRFLGEATLATLRLFIGKARYRKSDLFVLIQQAGAEAMGIVTLISFLVGLILAFVGAVQLQQFGATIYVADLVGIAMVREMGAMMTGIVMAGRTGASYAAQLGSMKVTQEIDALTTMGISPLEFLVLPRMVALFVMMPLLCLYADFVGILGGAAVGVGMLDLSPVTYYQQTAAAVSLGDLAGGIFKASIYGVLIAIAGCLRGMQSGNSSSAVGDATTSAVVTSIVAIIVACGVFAVLFYILGI
jgi:phospholipid/cholesterol/gamma-HCH transport system permease protein